MTTPFPPRSSLDSYLAALPAGALAGVPSEPATCVLARWLRATGWPSACVGSVIWFPAGRGGPHEPMDRWAREFGDAVQDATAPGRAITVGRARAVLGRVGERVEEVANA